MAILSEALSCVKFLQGFRSRFLTALLLILIVPAISLAQSTSSKTKDLGFANGARLQQYSLLDFSGIHQKLFVRPAKGDKTPITTLAYAANVMIYSPTVPAGRANTAITFAIALVDSKPRIIQQNGSMTSTEIEGSEITAWNGVSIQMNQQEFYVLSIKYKNTKSSTYIVRATDGAAVVVNDQYLDIHESDVKLEGESLHFAGRKIMMNPIELNPRFVAGKPVALNRIAAQPATSGDFARLNSLNASNDAAERLYNALSSQVYGQEQMLRRLSELYARSTVRTMTKPVVVVLTGPSGVGKSYVSQVFAKNVFQNESMFLEVDGNEFKAPIQGGNIEHHKLFGAPLGQQGGQKGSVTEFLKKYNGDGVIVINEADKMHPDMWMRFMELFDTGKTTSGAGRTVRSRNLYIILTSNRGTKVLFPDAVKNWSEEELKKYAAGITSEKVQEAYKSNSGPEDKFSLPDEVLGRVTEFITANPLTKETAIRIVKYAALSVMETARKNYDVLINVHDDVIEYLALTGFTNIKSGRLISRDTFATFDKILLKISKTWRLRKNDTVDVTLTHDAQGHPQLTSTYNGQSINIEAPRDADKNPLRDAELVDRINKFQVTLKSIVIGQDELLKSLTEILVAQYSDQFRTRPAAIYLIGSTGTGKTETGRAIALARYGSADRATVIPFGGVHNEAAYNSIFGVEPGYQGSLEERIFETALKNNPNGGVIIFDEVSNMGGGNAEIKRALFTKLYNLIEEGKWVSPIGPKRVYDLSKFTFIFTGNDGENLFQNVTSDDLRMSTWKDNKDRTKVRKILADANVPEAFINRMSDVFLMKPLLRNEISSIVKKMTNEKTSQWETQHAGAKIVFDPTFEQDLAKIFFSQDQGGRSVRKVLDDRVTSLVNASLVLMGAYPSGDTAGLEIHLGIIDNKSKRPYKQLNYPERKVDITIAISKNGQTIYKGKQDATEFADFSLLMDPQRAMQVAIHEAAHGVVNVESVTRERLALITLIGGRSKDVEYLGYARYEPIPNLTSMRDRPSVITHMAQLAAGRVGQNMAGFNTDAGWSNDLEKIRKIAKDYLTKWGEPQLMNLPLDKDGNVLMSTNQNAIFEQKFNELLAEAEREAKASLSAQWSLVRTIAAELLIKGTIDGPRFEKLKEYYLKNPHPEIGHHDWNYEQFNKEQIRRQAARAQNPDGICKDLFKYSSIPGVGVTAGQ